MNRRISQFPIHKPFDMQPTDSEFQRVILRLIVGFNTKTAYIVGTATVVCGHLLLTARHVIEDVLSRESVSQSDPPVVDNSLVALQIAPGPEYMLWHILNIWLCPTTDLAFLQVAGQPAASAVEPKMQWMQPLVRAFPPPVGQKVAAMGYRKSVLEVSKNEQGGLHHEMTDELIASVGVVRELFPDGRDSVRLPFPCYQVSARFDAGMSGGPVFDETGAVCGLVCANVAGSHIKGEPISYVTTLWPMFSVEITADRGDAFPRGKKYTVFELAHDKVIAVADFPELAALKAKI